MKSSNFNDRYFLSRERCPVCAFKKYTVLFQGPLAEDPVRSFIYSHYQKQGTVDWSYLVGTDFVLCDCPNCGLIYQKYVPNQIVLDNIYNVMAGPAFLKKLEAGRLTLDNFNRIAGELDILFRILGRHPTEVRFLDYGFGYGRWARVAVAMGAKVFATEISPEKIQYARTIGVEMVRPGDLLQLQFEIVHTEQVFEHLTNPDQDFRMLAATLTSDGLMKIAVPPQGNIRTLLKRCGMIDWSPQEGLWQSGRSALLQASNKYLNYVSILPLEHLNAYSPSAVAHMAASNNLRLISRVRRESVPICTLSASLLRRSMAQLSKVIVKSFIQPDSGYYIFARRR